MQRMLTWMIDVARKTSHKDEWSDNWQETNRIKKKNAALDVENSKNIAQVQLRFTVQLRYAEVGKDNLSIQKSTSCIKPTEKKIDI